MTLPNKSSWKKIVREADKSSHETDRETNDFSFSGKIIFKIHLPQFKNYQQTPTNLDNINSSHYNSVQIYNVSKVSSRKRVFYAIGFLLMCFPYFVCVLLYPGT